MDKRIFFADLDGTLLNDEKKITPLTHESLKHFLERGNYFVICTGRPINSALQVFQSLQLPVEGCYIISFNGAQIYDCSTQKTILRCEVSDELITKIFTLAENYGLHCQTYTDTHILSKSDNEAMQFYMRHIHMPLQITDDILGSMEVLPCKLMAIELYDHQKLEQFRMDLEKRYGDQLQLMYSNANYLEIFSSNASKGKAVQFLCNYLNVPLKNSFAAGDQQNDLSMIKAAGLGIAMCNGSDEIKKIADTITENDNNHDGLAPFLI